MDDRCIGIDELAALLGMSREWVRKRVQRRELPHRRFGRAVRFSAEDVRTIIDRAEAGPLEWRGSPLRLVAPPGSPPPSPPPPQPPRPPGPPPRRAA